MNKTPETITNKVSCPVCGSDMKRDGTDNPHDRYTGHFTCQNGDCNVSITVRN